MPADALTGQRKGAGSESQIVFALVLSVPFRSRLL